MTEKRGCYWCIRRKKIYCTHKKRNIQILRRAKLGSLKDLYELKDLIGSTCLDFKGKLKKEKVTFS